MAKKSKDVKPFPTLIAIIILVAFLAAMSGFIYYIISPPTDEPHIDSLGEQDFSDETSVEPPPPEVEVKEYMSEANIGDAVVFGKYEQDNNSGNGTEDIEWIVLDKTDTGLLLISRYVLDCKPYNETLADVNWMDCTLRAWLNGDFYNNAFDETEKQNIIGVGEFLSQDPMADSSVDFVDNVSILSAETATKYFEYDSWRMAPATAYASTYRDATNNDGNAWWWLRDAGEDMLSKDSVAEYVFYDGSIKNAVFSVEYQYVGVRPVIWVSLDAEREDADSSDNTDDTQPESSEVIEGTSDTAQ